MDRRHFLKYASLTTAGFVFAACNPSDSSDPQTSDRTSEPSPEDTVDFGELEKSDLTLGFIPVTDCAPLIIAQELGFFAQYGLNVSLSKQDDWQAVENGLLEKRLDASQALYGMPMLSQLGSTQAAMVALLVLNLNGSSITLSPKAWEAGIRPSTDYNQFQEFGDAYRNYIQKFEEPPSFATEFITSIDNYISRYWLSAMGINPEAEVEFMEIAPSQMIHKVKAGVMDGYGVSEPWNQLANLEKAGFTAYVNRDIWKGHPGNVLATMQPWIEENPTTARALVAAVLKACQFCDQVENRQELIEILAQSKYLDTDGKSVEPSLVGRYNYGGFDEKERIIEIPDFYIFQFRETDYLKKPNHANYPWRSHGVWLLTQMIRWNQIDQQEYPKDADELIDKIYPLEIYEEVAKAFKLELPSDGMKVEPAEVFIDGRKFDPSDPVAYLNNFEIRANAPQLFFA
ncbi:MAG TPA: nitrate transport protein, NrtC-like protein [Cyanobacteria bacterium UBA11162]|nr:nitrate transport protein, NrtC-like protein [Cyanobacteria bacterium UBA11162]